MTVDNIHVLNTLNRLIPNVKRPLGVWRPTVRYRMMPLPWSLASFPSISLLRKSSKLILLQKGAHGSRRETEQMRTLTMER